MLVEKWNDRADAIQSYFRPRGMDLGAAATIQLGGKACKEISQNKCKLYGEKVYIIRARRFENRVCAKVNIRIFNSRKKCLLLNTKKLSTADTSHYWVIIFFKNLVELDEKIRSDCYFDNDFKMMIYPL